ncbi:MAG: hypothetical protein ABL308_13285 [Oceanicaulis sp.]
MKTTSKFLAAAALLLAGAGAAHPEDATVRISVVGVVPAACSSGDALSRTVEGQTVTAVFDARCNTVHELRISGLTDPNAVVSVNDSAAGPYGALLRPAYFDAVTVVKVDLSSAEQAEQVSRMLRVHLTPLA